MDLEKIMKNCKQTAEIFIFAPLNSLVIFFSANLLYSTDDTYILPAYFCILDRATGALRQFA